MTAPGDHGVQENHGGEVPLAEVVSFVRRNWRWIVGMGFGAGVATALAIVLLVSPSFEASATLVIVPPAFSSELQPSSLTVQGYQKLLESDAVVAETKRRLVETDTLEPEARLRVGHNLATRIFVSRRSEETELAPMIQASARADTPVASAEVANTWAEVFLERTRELMGGTTSAAVLFIDQQYPQAKQELAETEAERVRTENAFQSQCNEIETRWDRMITRFKNETSEAEAAHRAETRRLLEEFSGDRNLETRTAQLDALRKAYGDLQDEQARVESQLELKRLQFEAAQNQIEATPQFLTLQKAITDEALWGAIASSEKNGARLEQLQDKSLLTQEINPVYTELSSRAARIEMELNALMPRAEQLDTRLAAIAEQMKSVDRALRTDNAALEKLERDREAGLQILREDSVLQLAILQRKQQEELDSTKREWTSRVAQLDRDVEQPRELSRELAQEYNEAVLAKGQEGLEDLRLGSPAVPPETAVPRGVALKSLAAAVFGAFFGLLIAAVRALGDVGGGGRSRANNQS
jgi:uncharacterized protein involved in exopolysaccharide biosynthesis